MMVFEPRGAQQGPGEQDGSDEERGDGPTPRNAEADGNAEDGKEEHGEAGGHAQGRRKQLAEGDGAAAFLNAPCHDDHQPDDGCNGGKHQRYVHGRYLPLI